MPAPLENRLLAALYLAFALTGVVTTLLGPLIPFLLRNCAMSDADAGILIAAQFAGNFAGALIANRDLRGSVLAGMPLIALGVAGLALVPCGLDALCTAGYGAGLGLTMSAINLIVARGAPANRASSLSLLNFVWGCGAVASPVLVGWAQRHNLVHAVFMTIAAVAFGPWLVVLAHKSRFAAASRAESPHSRWYSHSLLFFATLLFLYVGIETSVASWSAAYALRMRNAGDLSGVSAVGLFWLMLLIGRVACATVILRYVEEALVYAAALVLTMAGLTLLLAARSGNQVLAATSVIGLGLAPMFPLLLAFASGSLLASRNSGWAFSAAALGGAVAPWVTGRVSTSVHSLRAGFAVPAAAAVLTAALSLVWRKGAGTRRPSG